MRRSVVVIAGIATGVLLLSLIVRLHERPKHEFRTRGDACRIEPGDVGLPPGVARSHRRSGERSETRQTPPRDERLKMPYLQRLALLERLGVVPRDADWSDFAIAEKASWWGRKLDPELFWSNRVVWLDGEATDAAWRHGRSYPPIPYGDLAVADRSDEDEKGEGFDIQGGPSLHTVASERERAFWDKFAKTHPRPPDEIVTYQQREARTWINMRARGEEAPGLYARHRMELGDRLSGRLQSIRGEAAALGFPLECMTPEAYYWARVLEARREYETMVANGQDSDPIVSASFYRHLHVDRKLITEPLSDDSLKAADSWKVAYLRRLRLEKADETYIAAYLKAWNLSSNEVFGATQ